VLRAARPLMCGFAAWFDPQGGSPDPEALAAAASTLAHRGPDDAAFHVEPGLGDGVIGVVELGRSGEMRDVAGVNHEGRFCRQRFDLADRLPERDEPCSAKRRLLGHSEEEERNEPAAGVDRQPRPAHHQMSRRESAQRRDRADEHAHCAEAEERAE